MGKHGKARSTSAAPFARSDPRYKGKNAMTDDDREALQLNNFEKGFTLYELQNRIKRQPDMYKQEFRVHFGLFADKLKEFKENPARKDQEIIDYFKFLAHVSGVYREQLANLLSTEMINLLQQYYSILNPEVRMTLVTCLKIMRGKEVVQAQVVLPVFFKLFRCKDKQLREFLKSIIISDLKTINKNGKNTNLNKKLQNFIHTLLQDPNETAAKRSLAVMIELYKRKIWNDDKSVNAIADACLNSNPKVVVAACRFFLILEYDYESEDEASSDEEDARELLKHHKGSKLTKAKRKYLDRAIKSQKRKEQRKNKTQVSTDFLPIDMIYDAQSFAEKLFAKLRKSNDKYEVKLLMLRLISRLIGRHNLLVLSFYPVLLRYLNMHQKEKIGEVFAMIIESCHELVPPEDIKPVIEKIISNFVTEYCPNTHITIGLNSVREILSRMPLALDESQIEYLVQFRQYRNSSVVAAAKSLVNFFRDVCPHLLPRKFRGRFTKVDEDNKKENMVYGHKKVFNDIEGIEFLRKADGLAEDDNVAAQRMLTDNDFKKMKILKLRQAVKKVDRHGFRSDDDGDSSSDDDSSGDEEMEEEDGYGSYGDEEGEVMSENDDKAKDVKRSKKTKRSKSADMAAAQSDQEAMMMGEDGEDMMSYGSMLESGEQYMFEEGESYTEFSGESATSSIMNNHRIVALGKDEGSDDEAPALVPINDKMKTSTKPDPQEFESSEAEQQEGEDGESDVEQLKVIDSDNYVSSAELENFDSDGSSSGEDQAKKHGFVYSHHLDTYRGTKKERVQAHLDTFDKDEHRKKFQRKRDEKKGGKSNIEQLKNKPFMMVQPKKKRNQQNKMYDKKTKINKYKTQLGKFNKRKEQRIEGKKRGRIE